MLDNLLISLPEKEGAELELKILGAGVSLAPFIWPEPSVAGGPPGTSLPLSATHFRVLGLWRP